MYKQCLKGLSDIRDYRIISLDNKIDAILIHDPETDKSAACIGVGVGSCHDFDGANGIAHFLEHMLFLGTEKYPKQNEYMDYIYNNSGSYGAYTADDQTIYYFQVSNKCYETATDIFSQFFISPLFTEELTQKEINTVHSEYELRLMNDLWRKWQLLKSCSISGHPFSKFNIGNIETLQIPGIRELIIDFYQKYYSANNMKLVLYSNLSLDDLQKLASEKFNQIKNNDIFTPKIQQNPYQSQNLSKLIKFIPVEDKDFLEIVWFTQNMTPHYKSNPHKYITHLLGNEGQNSLLALLIEEGLALELSASHFNLIDQFDNIWIQIRLTQEGLKKWRDVYEYVYKYLKIIETEGIQPWIFEEVQTTNQISFNFNKKQEPLNYVSSIAEGMFNFPLQDVLVKNYLFEQYDPNFIKNEIQQLTHQNMIVLLSSKSFQQECQEVEYWYSIKYSIDSLDQDLINRSLNPQIKPKISKNNLGIPIQNIFLPKSFEIYNTPNSEIPELIYSNENTQIYFKQDNHFKQPKAQIQVILYTKRLIYKNSNALCLSQIWVSMFQLYIKNFSYLADAALLTTKIETKASQLKINFSGFNDSMKNYVPLFFEKIIEFNVNDHEFMFQNVVQQIIQEQKSLMKKDTYLKVGSKIVYDFHKLCMCNFDVCEIQEILDFLEQLTYEQFQAFSLSWLKNIYAQWLFLGNIKQDQCLDISNQVRCSTQKWNTLNKLEIIEKRNICRLLDLPPQQNLVFEHFIQNLEDYQENHSCFSVFYQMGIDQISSHILTMLISNYMTVPTSDQLRITEQLGYIVWAHYIEFYVSSNFKSPQYISTRAKEFLEKMREKVRDMTDEEFNRIKQSVNLELSKKDVTLDNEMARYTKQIEYFKYIFDIKTKRIEALKSITKSQLQQTFEDKLFQSPIKLEVHLIQKNHIQENNETKFSKSNKEQIPTSYFDNYKKFKRNFGWSKDYISPFNQT